MRRAFFWLTAAWTLLGGFAGAQETHRADREAVGWALRDDVGESEQALLDKLASLEESDCRVAGPCTLDTDSRSRVQRLVNQLLQKGSWDASALADVIPGGLRPQAPEVRANLERLAAGLVLPECQRVREGLELAIQEGLRPSPALETTTLRKNQLEFASAGKRSCLEATIGKEGVKAFENYRFISVYALSDDDVSLFWGGEQPGWIAGPPRVLLGGHAVFVGAAPRDVGVTVRVQGTKRLVPQVWSRFLNDDLVDWVIPRATRGMTCLDVRVLGNEDNHARVLLNGYPVRPGVFQVFLDDYDLRLVDSRTRHSVSWRSLTRAALDSNVFGCEVVTFDATDSQAIAIVGVSANPACVDLGLDANVLRARVNLLLARSGKQVRDVEGLVETIRGLEAVYSGLSSFAGKATGPDRGELDTWKVLGNGASELRRQGFDRTLAVSLTCSGTKDGTPGGHEYTVTATSVRLRELEKVQTAPSGGFDLANALETRPEVVQLEREIGSAISAAVRGVLDLPYVRFLNSSLVRPFHDVLQELIDVHVTCPGGKSPACSGRLDLYARRLETDDAANTCNPVDAYFELRSAQVPTIDKKAEEWQIGRPVGPNDRRINLEWHPDRRGVYLLTVVVAEDGNTQSDTLHCVTVVNPRTDVWVDAGYAKTAFTLGPMAHARSESVGYTHIFGGIAVETSSGSPLQMGFTVGYARTDHARDASTIWTDALVGGVSATGKTRSGVLGAPGLPPLFYSRQSALLGPLFALELEAVLCPFIRETQLVARAVAHLASKRNERYASLAPCIPLARALGLEVRIQPLVDIGILEATSDVVSAYPTFFQNAREIKIEVSAAFQLGLRAHLDENKSVYLLSNAVLGGLSDLLLNNRLDALSRPTYDAFLGLGFVVGMTYGL